MFILSYGGEDVCALVVLDEATGALGIAAKAGGGWTVRRPESALHLSWKGGAVSASPQDGVLNFSQLPEYFVVWDDFGRAERYESAALSAR